MSVLHGPSTHVLVAARRSVAVAFAYFYFFIEHTSRAARA